MEYYSYLDLKNNTLSFNDLLFFMINNKLYKYKVKSNYIHYTEPHKSNDVIFDALNIIDKYKFCSKYYGYLSEKGDFPIFEDYDYKTLTKLVLEIFKLCDNYVEDNIWD